MAEAQYKIYPFGGSPFPLRWPYFKERLRTLPDLPDELKADGEAALSFLEKELGKGFFDTCGRNHPVLHKLMMAGGEGQLKEFIHWIRVLRQLKAAASNYPHLLQKLHSRTKVATEAIPFLEIGARHLALGFDIYFPEEKEGQKNSDLELICPGTGEKVFIEVSRISEGRLREKQDRLYYSLLNLCFRDGYSLPVAGKLYKLVPDDHLTQLFDLIKALKDEAATQRKVAAYRDQYLAIAFAHSDCLDELDRWSTELQLARRFDGFDVEYDYTMKIIKNSRLRREVKQIPESQPGLIYCPVHILYMLTMNVPETVAALAIELGRYKNIFGVVFYGEVMPPLDEPFLVDDPLFNYAMRRNEAHVGRYTLLVKNPSFDLPLSTAVRTALADAAI
ncbi:hypothetical protein [Mucilaginibacter ginsenosidivorans]|uniref:Uncharacterized protein n=1 Tax=Mucilaginibacter ginsenosidivorans TaxID=398053 RepID=A0A5B8UU31_9SPHI|nr:hypothetical protein [Mucilaginibacter ginsenosidivorans]QEC62409.1 hypothetical protein FRZ54_07360 [Mucilaginibacter ginsenosidivorans]